MPGTLASRRASHGLDVDQYCGGGVQWGHLQADFGQFGAREGHDAGRPFRRGPERPRPLARKRDVSDLVVLVGIKPGQE